MERFRSKLTPKLLMGLSDTSTRHPATLMAVRLKELSLRSVPTTNTSVLSVLSLSLLADIHIHVGIGSRAHALVEDFMTIRETSLIVTGAKTQSCRVARRQQGPPPLDLSLEEVCKLIG